MPPEMYGMIDINYDIHVVVNANVIIDDITMETSLNTISLRFD